MGNGREGLETLSMRDISKPIDIHINDARKHITGNGIVFSNGDKFVNIHRTDFTDGKFVIVMALYENRNAEPVYDYGEDLDKFIKKACDFCGFITGARSIDKEETE